MSLGIRRLGSTGAEVSELALGTLTFGRETDEPTSAEILHTYLDAGGNMLDTADSYGRSEEVLGRLIKGVRHELLIASKVGLPTSAGPNSEGTSRLRVTRQIERTLQRLDTDWIDVYYCHAWDRVTPLDETLAALDNLVSSGKVRYLGVSNWFAWQIAKALGRAELRRWASIAVVTAEYSLIARGVEREIVPLCLNEGLGIIPWGPIGGGVLAGKYRDGEQAPAGSRGVSRTNSSSTIHRRLANERNRTLVDEVRAIAEQLGRTPAQVALNWVMNRPAVTTPVIGARTVAQLIDNLGSSGWTLNEADQARLDDASAISLGYPADWERAFGIRQGPRPDREVELRSDPNGGRLGASR